MSSSTAESGVAVGKRMAAARRELGLTQADLAARIGVSLRALDRYESGTVEPTPEVLELVAEVTGVSVSSLTSSLAEPVGDGMPDDPPRLAGSTPAPADARHDGPDGADLSLEASAPTRSFVGSADLVERISGAVGEAASSPSDRDPSVEKDEADILRRAEAHDLGEGPDEGGAMSETSPANARSAAQDAQSALPAPPLDIRHEDLPKKTLGYSPKATAELFDQVADAYARLWEDRAVLERKVEELEVQLIVGPERADPVAVSDAEAKLEESDASRRQLALQLEQSASALSAARQEISRLSYRVKELEEEVQSSGERVDQAAARADQAEAAVGHYREQERLIGEILVSARRNSSEIEETAKREADRIRRDAQREASELLAKSEREVERLAGERERLEALASEVQDDLSAFLVGALERVNGREETEAQGATGPDAKAEPMPEPMPEHPAAVGSESIGAASSDPADSGSTASL